MNRPQDDRPSPGPTPPKAVRPPRVFDAQRLMGDEREIRLRFRKEEYRLRVTRNDKLILTK